MSEMALTTLSAPCWSTMPRKATSAPSAPLSWPPIPTSCSPPSRSPSRSWSCLVCRRLDEPVRPACHMAHELWHRAALRHRAWPGAGYHHRRGRLRVYRDRRAGSKRIGLANAEGVSKQVVGPLSFFQKIAHLLVWLTGACSDGLAASCASRAPTTAKMSRRKRSSTWSRSRTTCSTRKSA